MKKKIIVEHFSIGTEKPGAVTFNCSLVSSSSGGQLTGMGHITQAINPPLDMTTYLYGNSVSFIGWGAITIITLTGLDFGPFKHWHGGVGPVDPENVKCTIYTDRGNLEKCTANLSYLHEGKWITLENQPVKVRFE